MVTAMCDKNRFMCDGICPSDPWFITQVSNTVTNATYRWQTLSVALYSQSNCLHYRTDAPLILQNDGLGDGGAKSTLATIQDFLLAPKRVLSFLLATQNWRHDLYNHPASVLFKLKTKRSCYHRCAHHLPKCSEHPSTCLPFISTYVAIRALMYCTVKTYSQLGCKCSNVLE